MKSTFFKSIKVSPFLWILSVAVVVVFVIYFFTFSGFSSDISYLNVGQDSALKNILNDSTSSESILYKKLDDNTKQKIAYELLINRIDKPTYINLIVVLAFLLSMFLLITFIVYYTRLSKLKKSMISEVDEKNNNFNTIIKTINDLDKSIIKYDFTGIIALGITFIVLIILTAFIFDLFKGSINQINQLTGNNVLLGVIIVFLRTSLLGSFIILFIINMIKFTRSAFDQAVRFNKRKHATLFLFYLLKDDKHQGDLEKIMNAFRQWNLTVESAFTDHKFDTEIAKSMFEMMAKYTEVIKNIKPESSVNH